MKQIPPINLTDEERKLIPPKIPLRYPEFTNRSKPIRLDGRLLPGVMHGNAKEKRFRSFPPDLHSSFIRREKGYYKYPLHIPKYLVDRRMSYSLYHRRHDVTL